MTNATDEVFEEIENKKFHRLIYMFINLSLAEA
jgi:hypothetical protein